MNVTFSPEADMILGRYKDFQARLLEALRGLPGHCFIDGRVGRSPADDQLVLLCQDRAAMTIPHHEFADAATIRRIMEEWSSSGSQ